jgi:hypothetical protein
MFRHSEKYRIAREDRLNRAANEDDGYTDGRSSAEAKDAQKAIDGAKVDGAKIDLGVTTDNHKNIIKWKI